MLSLASSIRSIVIAIENISSGEFMDLGTFKPKSDIASNPKSKPYDI